MSLGRKIFTSTQLRKIDQYTIQNEPIASIDLMERAALALTNWICQKFSQKTRFLIFSGPGNNGGDALAVSRLLFKQNYTSQVFLVTGSGGKLSTDADINLHRLREETNVEISFLKAAEDFPEISKNNVIIDGLFGQGLTRPIDGFFARVVTFLNDSPAKTIAIDIPSGLFDYDNTKNDLSHVIKATFTLSLELPKLSFFLEEYEKYVGEWVVLPIGLHPTAVENEQTPYYFVTKSCVQTLINKRPKFSHKGTFGHALLIAGSKGKIGAAVLGAKAGMRSGLGLLTVHTPTCGYFVLQTTIPESMVIADNDENTITRLPELKPYSAIGIGPGIGQALQTAQQLEQLLKTTQVPLVIDADAINLIAKNRNLLKLIPPNTIFTPHVKEFERLCGKQSKDSFFRLKHQQEFSQKYNCIIVLKGAYTSISLANADIYFNTTGNPGMATAGSGDVLTGIILSLLAQSVTPARAAILGTFVHGQAGDFAAEKYSEQGLIAGDIIQMLPQAWKNLCKQN